MRGDMKKYIVIWLILVALALPGTSSAIKITDFSDGSAVLTVDDVFWFTDDPAAAKDDHKVTFDDFFLWLFGGTAAITGQSDGIVRITGSAPTVATSISAASVEVDTASRIVCSDANKKILACSAATGTGIPVLATGPTITLGENSTVNNGTGPTVNAAGEVGIDTTSDQFKYYGGAERVIPYKKTFSAVVPSVADTDDMVLMKAPYGMTMVALDCIVSAATSATINIQECDSAGANCVDTATSDLVCDTDGANTSTFNNAAIDSGDWIKLDVASISGTPGTLTVTATFSVVAD
jgi:hypothetical protein